MEQSPKIASNLFPFFLCFILFLLLLLLLLFIFIFWKYVLSLLVLLTLLALVLVLVPMLLRLLFFLALCGLYARSFWNWIASLFVNSFVFFFFVFSFWLLLLRFLLVKRVRSTNQNGAFSGNKCSSGSTLFRHLNNTILRYVQLDSSGAGLFKRVADACVYCICVWCDPI